MGYTRESKLALTDCRYTDGLSAYVAPPGDDTRNSGPMDECDRLIFS